MSLSTDKTIIATIGRTGAMRRPIITALDGTSNYRLCVVTRDTQSEQAKNLAKKYSNVELIEDNFSADKRCDSYSNPSMVYFVMLIIGIVVIIRMRLIRKR
jgi:hypothetical protein